jgi:hypothetical protein
VSKKKEPKAVENFWPPKFRVSDAPEGDEAWFEGHPGAIVRIAPKDGAVKLRAVDPETPIEAVIEYYRKQFGGS